MTEGKPLKLIVKFSIPLLLGNIFQQMYNMVDSIIVGNYIGKEALAAVGTSFILNFLLVSLFMGIGMGATILISQFFGAGKMEKVKSVVDTMYITMIIGAIVVSIAGILLSKPLLLLMNTPSGTTLDMGVTYIQTIFIGTIASFGFNVNSSILQGIGDSKSSLLFLIIATVINSILDIIFVAVFKMGVFGAALATIIAQLFSFLFGIWFINKKVKIIHITLRHAKFDSKIMFSSIKIGLPAGLQNALFSVGTMVLQRLVNSYGPGFMAGYSATNKIDSFAFMPIASFSSAVTTYVGQNVGAKKLDRVKTGVRQATILSALVCVVISFFVFIGAKFLVSAFSPDLEVIETGVAFLHRLMPFYFLLAISFVMNAALRGAGSSILPLFSAIASLLVIRLPSAYILDHFFGKNEMFWCFAIGWIVGMPISTGYYLSGKWKKKAFTHVDNN